MWRESSGPAHRGTWAIGRTRSIRRRRSGPTCVSREGPAIPRVLMQPPWRDAVVLRHRQTLAEVAEQITLGGETLKSSVAGDAPRSGVEEFDAAIAGARHVWDMWATGGKRRRWVLRPVAQPQAIDPLLFAMLGARAMAQVRLGEFEAAAEWGLKAAARPDAHSIILATAAYCLALAGRLDEGRTFAVAIRRALTGCRTNDFLQSFRFVADAAALFRQASKRIGFD
jgi:hypothetical protein